ncbi:MAG: EcoRV family type II restriction endonuclease [Defluviitaleaceae bacterium]|nr:EcoRV family type II restriction endonuclease [Defluviitaleaceae bacterium]
MKLSEKYYNEKLKFQLELSEFAQSLGDKISKEGEWNIKGFVDIFKNIYTISSDTKVISKILELHLFPYFTEFAEITNYHLELPKYQNYYPDITFINKKDNKIKFAVDLKTTYLNQKRQGYCNGFTLGSHGEYFINRESSKNIHYPYNQYVAHFCFGIIYNRVFLTSEFEAKNYSVDDIENIPSVINNFIFFAQEKWKIASDKRGSGNTANIGSIKKVDDILVGNGIFSEFGEDIFNDYWINYGKIQIETEEGTRKTMTSLNEYISYRGISHG